MVRSDAQLSPGSMSAHDAIGAPSAGPAHRRRHSTSRSKAVATPSVRTVLQVAGYGTVAVAIAVGGVLRDRGPHPVRAARRTALDVIEPFADAVSNFFGLGVPPHSDSDIIVEAILAAIVAAQGASRRGDR